MPARARLEVAALCLAGSLAVTGCGNRSLSVHDSGAFKTAAPELKAEWDLAMAASKTNGYLTAYKALQDLSAQTKLTAEQAKTVEESLGIIGTQMFEAANKGDPEATRAMKEIQSHHLR